MCIRDSRTDLVVLLALLGVGEHGIRLADVLEALLGLRVTRVLVGVQFAGQLAVGPVSYTHLDVYKRQALEPWVKVMRLLRAQAREGTTAIMTFAQGSHPFLDA